MNNSRGNALFLILIAVALFAALSYAVTNSGRGGSGIDREQAEILAAELMNQAAAIQSQYQRLKIIGGYDQILFNTTAETSSGNCYSGDTVTSGCSTIGIFSTDSGLPIPSWNNELSDPAFLADNRVWIWNTRRVYVNGADIGTSAPDEMIYASNITKEVCEVINRKTNNTSDILEYNSSATTADGIASQHPVSYTHLTLPTKA